MHLSACILELTPESNRTHQNFKSLKISQLVAFFLFPKISNLSSQVEISYVESSVSHRYIRKEGHLNGDEKPSKSITAKNVIAYGQHKAAVKSLCKSGENKHESI